MRRHCISGLFVGLVAITGCLYPVAHHVESSVAESAAVPRDLQPVSHAAEPWAGAKDEPGVDQSEPTKPGEKAKPILLNIPAELPASICRYLFPSRPSVWRVTTEFWRTMGCSYSTIRK